MSHPKIILIAGPTAAGKSALALDLARQHHGAIINADAMQVYAGLPILTNQPGAADRAIAPHELYGTLDSAIPCSVGRWLELASTAIRQALAAGRTAIVTGGTGLYFRALTGGLAEIPPIPVAVRQAAQALYGQAGEEAFRLMLAKHDPVSAGRLARNDRQRLIRAFEVVQHTGKPLSVWQSETVPGSFVGQDIETQLVMPDRSALYAACDHRFTDMIAAGAVAEAAAFLQRKLPPSLPAMKTIGLREINAYLNGVLTLDATIAKAQQATRNYAKRQMTWFRNQRL